MTPCDGKRAKRGHHHTRSLGFGSELKGTPVKKLAFVLIAAAALVFGAGQVATAQYGPSISTGPVTPGGPYTVTYTNCVVGDTITFTQAQSNPTSVQATCLPGGTATASFAAAPTAAGTYSGTAVGAQSPSLTFTFTLTAPATTVPVTTAPGGGGAVPTTAAPGGQPGGQLPATGSNGLGSTTGIALGLLVVGLGLFVVAQVRRRDAATTG
jgi:hypothetical protein